MIKKIYRGLFSLVYLSTLFIVEPKVSLPNVNEGSSHSCTYHLLPSLMLAQEHGAGVSEREIQRDSQIKAQRTYQRIEIAKRLMQDLAQRDQAVNMIEYEWKHRDKNQSVETFFLHLQKILTHQLKNSLISIEPAHMRQGWDVHFGNGLSIPLLIKKNTLSITYKPYASLAEKIVYKLFIQQTGAWWKVLVGLFVFFRFMSPFAAIFFEWLIRFTTYMDQFLFSSFIQRNEIKPSIAANVGAGKLSFVEKLLEGEGRLSDDIDGGKILEKVTRIQEDIKTQFQKEFGYSLTDFAQNIHMNREQKKAVVTRIVQLFFHYTQLTYDASVMQKRGFNSLASAVEENKGTCYEFCVYFYGVAQALGLPCKAYEYRLGMREKLFSLFGEYHTDCVWDDGTYQFKLNLTLTSAAQATDLDKGLRTLYPLSFLEDFARQLFGFYSSKEYFIKNVLWKNLVGLTTRRKIPFEMARSLFLEYTRDNVDELTLSLEDLSYFWAHYNDPEWLHVIPLSFLEQKIREQLNRFDGFYASDKMRAEILNIVPQEESSYQDERQHIALSPSRLISLPAADISLKKEIAKSA